MTRTHQLATATCAVALTFATASAANASTPSESWSATATLQDADGNEVGTVAFSGDAAATRVDVTLSGVTEGLEAYHGIHVHANDDDSTCDPAADPVFSDVGGHWNPTDEPHGHHAGDLPPVFIGADGSGSASSTIGPLEASDLEGRAVILHAGADNLANIPDRYETVGSEPLVGPDEMTLANGDAGPRYACGLIALDGTNNTLATTATDMSDTTQAGQDTSATTEMATETTVAG
jgi:Cu-Zn family superoxide dismutase